LRVLPWTLLEVKRTLRARRGRVDLKRLTHFGSQALEFAAMRNANLTVLSYRNNGWNESP